jgi:putative membrane protein
MLSKPDHDRIHAAIATAEEATAGEIFCVVARESATYREVPFAWAAAVALLAPPLSLLLGIKPSFFLAGMLMVMSNGWVVAHAGGVNAAVAATLLGYAALQGALFLVVLVLIMMAPPIRRLLTPAALKHAHVHARAMEQFAHRLHAARAATGVLVFASLAERRVEIIADEAIHAKVGTEVWDRAVQAALGPIRAGDPAKGLIAAVEICGRALAEHCPPDGVAHGSVDDVIEI